MGKVQQSEDKRITDALVAGRRMIECPIGADGSEKGVYQSIGPDEDMPFFMVEVLEDYRYPEKKSVAEHEAEVPHSVLEPELVTQQSAMEDVRADTNTQRKPGGPSIMSPKILPSDSHDQFDSPLSSLGKTPPSAEVAHSAFRSRHDSSMEFRDNIFALDTPSMKIPRASSKMLRHPHGQQTEPYALVLQVGTDLGAWPGHKASSTQKTDMKIEVWLNGSLVQVLFINRQRWGPIHKHRFAGTRMHRQIEAPWIYRSAAQAGTSALTAEQRWESVAKLLAKQVGSRGVDKLGNLPPSADFLQALSKVKFPDRLKDQANLGILDIIITTGKGNKLSPSHAYENCPAPMGSTVYKVRTRSVDDDDNEDRTGAPQQDNGSAENVPTKHAPHQPMADSTGVAKRRASRRIAGESSNLSSDHFLSTTGQEESGRLPIPPIKLTQDPQSSALSVTKGSADAEPPEAFEVPELCKGCVISYADSSMQRQIAKSRPGEFEENALVVGFRFVVV